MLNGNSIDTKDFCPIFFHSPSPKLTAAPGMQQVYNKYLLNKFSIFTINIYFKAQNQDSPKIKFTDSIYLHDTLNIYNQIIIVLECSSIHWETSKQNIIYTGKCKSLMSTNLITYIPLLSNTEILQMKQKSKKRLNRQTKTKLKQTKKYL